MENKEKLYSFLPRHIRKLAQEKESLSQSIMSKDGYLNMDTSVSLLGTVGTDENYSFYPDSKAKKLKDQLAEYTKMNTNQLCIANGSSELIDLAIRIFCNPNKDSILCFSPAKQAVQDFARMHAIELDVLDLEQNFDLPIYEIKKAIKETTKVIFIENPNQILGNCYSSFDIVDLVTNFEGLVVIDESAIDYIADKSLVSLINTCNNVIVIQSFSGAWGLAGLPVGMAYGQPELINVLNLLKPPFSVNVMAQQMALRALYVADQKDRVVERIIEQREQVKVVLEKLPAVKKVHDSETNTLLIEVENAKEMAIHLQKEEQIIVLNLSSIPGLENCIRVSIGTGLQNMRLVKAIKDMPYKTSAGRMFWKGVSRTLRKASMYLGVFKKILGS
jgi:histidinol-phosphate aminotransferase